MFTKQQIIASPGRIIIFASLMTILIGTILLSLPISQNCPMNWIDCLFTATSMTSATGILSVTFESFSTFGKIILMILMQIGGIGLITILTFIASLFVNLDLSTQIMAGQALGLHSWKNVKKVIFFIIFFTLITEIVGATVIFKIIQHDYTYSQAIFNSIFHSISSFCNVGLSNFGNSMIIFQNNFKMLTITAILIFLGGLGFLTWYELIRNAFKKGEFQKKLSLNTKIIIIITTILITLMTIILIALESKSQFVDSYNLKIFINMLFNAIAFRSAGLTTIDMNTLQISTIFIIMIYSLIGSSPGSTGGGLKVTTFAILLATMKAVMSGKTNITIQRTTIVQHLVLKAMALFIFSCFWITISTIFLLLVEKHNNFTYILFETVSTFTNLGLATDITTNLSCLGKIIVTLNMFVGRVGPLTILLAVRSNLTLKERLEENLMIG